jgi:thioredoxin-like negative regulator of GroEL
MFKKGLARDPSKFECAFWISHLYHMTNRHQAGIKLLSSHLLQYPNSHLKEKLADIYQALEDYKNCARIVDDLLAC